MIFGGDSFQSILGETSIQGRHIYSAWNLAKHVEQRYFVKTQIHLMFFTNAFRNQGISKGKYIYIMGEGRGEGGFSLQPFSSDHEPLKHQTSCQ